MLEELQHRWQGRTNDFYTDGVPAPASICTGSSKPLSAAGVSATSSGPIDWIGWPPCSGPCIGPWRSWTRKLPRPWPAPGRRRLPQDSGIGPGLGPPSTGRLRPQPEPLPECRVSGAILRSGPRRHPKWRPQNRPHAPRLTSTLASTSSALDLDSPAKSQVCLKVCLTGPAMVEDGQAQVVLE